MASISYGILAIYLGVAPELPTRDDAGCADRVRLLRDRMLTTIERSDAARSLEPDDDVVLNLIRETQATCAASQSDRLRELEKLWLRQRRNWEREAEVRQALRAL